MPTKRERGVLMPEGIANMKALTISQPHASRIAYGVKWIENRKWTTNYRGPLAIHAGKGTQYMSAREMREDGYPSGCIIAVANLVACVRLSELRSQFARGFDTAVAVGVSTSDVLLHEHTEGPWCWVLRDVRRIDPIPCSGALGLWDCPKLPGE